MKKPESSCPACIEIRKQESTGNWVSICGVIYKEFTGGSSNYENFTIVADHCVAGKYLTCPVWREEKEKGWARTLGKKYSSLHQAEKIRL